MRRIWAAVAATWALLAIVTVLAWSHPPVTPQGGGGGQVVMIQKGKGGKARAVLLPGSVATHTTTHSSPPR